MSILRSLEEKYVVAMKKLQFGEFSLLGNSVRYLHVVYLLLIFHMVVVFIIFGFHMSALWTTEWTSGQGSDTAEAEA